MHSHDIALSSLWIPAFAPSVVGVFFMVVSDPVLAQITPDNTLGNEGSIVLPDQTIRDLPADLIQGGATRGSNLFHSFLEFNVNEGQRVYFDNPSGIDRILSRVTGSDVSDILGTLGVNGGADLFFLNPNGIIFGGGTRLDLGGSFVATTAKGVLFQNYEFSTVNPDVPPLLNINLPIGLQMGQNPGSLRMLGGSSTADFRVSVPAQKTLSLLAGSILVEDLQVVSPNSVIQLGALAEPGLVGLGEDLRFAFPEGVERGDITLQNRAVFDTRGTGGDRISVNARNLLVQNASALWTGIAKSEVSTLPSLGIDIVTTGNTNILNFSQLSTASLGIGDGGPLSITARKVSIGGLGSELPPNQPDDPEFPSDPFLYTIVSAAIGVTATGNAGNVLINADSLFVEDGASISSITWGDGNAGDIDIKVKDSMRMRGLDTNGGPVIIASGVSPTAKGSGGTIRIQTRELSGEDGANIITNTSSSGDAGRIEIQAETITLAGEHGFGGTTGIYSQIRSEGDGTPRKSRGISIDTGTLLLLNGAQVNTSVFIRRPEGFVGEDRESTFSVGDAGAIDIYASEKIILEGQNSGNHPEGFRGSRIASQIRLQGVGNASSVRITTPFLSLSDYGEIVADTLGAGNASSIFINASESLVLNENTRISVETSGSGSPGNIEITTPDLTIAKDARISATVTETSTYQGDSGNITLNVSNIDLSGKLGIFAETNSIARAGDLTIQPTASDRNLNIRFRDDGFISASTTASGDGGSISLTAPETIDISGSGRVAVSTSGSGNAGLINLTAPTINLGEGVTLSGSTSGSGQGGTIVIQARDSLNLNTATIEALTTENSTGNGGDIFIDPITTTLKDSRIILDSAGTGIGGNLQLTSDFLHLDNSSISAQTRSSDGGSLTLNIPKLLTLENNSVISTQAGTAESGGNGGNITINANLIVGSGNSDIIANAFEGNGGNITITTQGLFGFIVENTNTPRTNLTNDITASSQLGTSSTPNISQALDPSQSLAVLDTNVADLTSQIDRRCDLARTPNASRFVVTGKGGLPPNDRNRLSLHPLWTALDLSADSTDPGQTFYSEGNYAEAIDSWETALQTPDLPPDQQISLLASVAQGYAIQGQWTKAEEAIDRGLNLIGNGSDRLRAQLLITQSYLLTEQGQLDQALRLSEQTSQIYQNQNDRFGLLQTQLNQAQILTRQGNLRLASDRLTTAQKSLNTDNNTLAGAIALELGTVQRLMGDYAAAQTTLEQSETLFSQLSTLHHAAALLALGDNDRDQFVPLNRQFNNIQEQIALIPAGSRGEAETRSGEIIARYNSFSNQALTHYRQVQATALTPNQRVQALTQEFLITIDLTTSRTKPDWSAVNELSENVQTQLNQLPLSSIRLYTQLNLAEGLLALQRKNATSITPEALTTLLTRTLEDALNLGDRRAQVRVLSQLASFYEQQQKWKESQQFTEAALSLAQETGSADLTYRLSWQLGRLQYAQGNTQDAIVSYNDSIQTLNTLRSDINTAGEEVRFSFRDAIDPIYREMVSLLLSQDTPETPHPENVIQARNLIESLQLSELVNFFQADCDVSSLTSIDELDPHSAVIYPIVLSDRLEVIVRLPGKPLQHYATDLSQTNLTQGAYLIQRELADPLSKRYLPLVQKLYDAIIRPVEADLQASDIQNLVFVLDGPLRNLPMSILHDGSQFLVEKYAIAVTPGLQLFDPQPLQQQNVTALLGGLTEARQGFTALPNVKAEIASIQGSIPSEVLLDAQFVEQNLTTEISSSPFPIVHLATHGEFGSTAEDTFILTWDDRIDVNEFSTLLQRRTGNRPVELLILSACRTAVGDDRAALGLAGIAVRSGARSTLASLWYISDEATSVLMGKLYKGLSQQNMTKAEAVRQAQLELLKDPQYANPYYWAPFVLVGNWL